MSKVKQPIKPQVSRSLLPKTETACLSPDQLHRLYYRTTTGAAFVPKNMPSNPSFSDVHKAAQYMGKYKPSIAPFWSREMSRYRQAYIALPLDGAVINRELAETFRPEATLTHSLPLSGHTRYSEDFGVSSEGVDCRGVNCRPKQRKHVRENEHLIYTDSITHENFSDLSSHIPKRRLPFRPEESKTVTLKFNGVSRYNEEYVDVSNSAYRIDPVKVSDDSNRVQGNSIPNRLRDYMYNTGMSASDLSVLDDNVKVSQRKNSDVNANPFIEEFLTYHRRVL